MNTIQLSADGRLSREAVPICGDPLPYLNHGIELASDVTLRSFFLILEVYPDLTRLNSFFPATLDQYRTSPGRGCTTDGFDFLEFRKSVEMIGFPGDPRLEIFTSLKGITSEADHSIHSTSLLFLLDMPLRLGRLRHVIFGDHVDVFEFDTVINLFEFIDGVAWELSFQNLPQKCEIRR